MRKSQARAAAHKVTFLSLETAEFVGNFTPNFHSTFRNLSESAFGKNVDNLSSFPRFA